MAVDFLPFFVYGTLLSGEANHHLLRRVTLTWRPARLSGAVMYDLGPYPMIVEAEGTVVGDLVEIVPDQYAATLRRLDRLEGVNSACPENPNGLYRRVRRIVSLEASPNPVEAWVYLGKIALAQRGILRPNGDWRRRFE